MLLIIIIFILIIIIIITIINIIINIIMLKNYLELTLYVLVFNDEEITVELNHKIFFCNNIIIKKLYIK